MRYYSLKIIFCLYSIPYIVKNIESLTPNLDVTAAVFVFVVSATATTTFVFVVPATAAATTAAATTTAAAVADWLLLF